MALCDLMKCTICGEEKYIYYHTYKPREPVCDQCKENLEAIQKEIALSRLKTELTFDERLARIEKWIYEHEHNHPTQCHHDTLF